MDTNYKKYHRDSDYVKFELTFRNIFAKRFQLIQKYIGDRTGKVLDIGCSNGVFLDLFKEEGWETWGIEPSVNSEVAKKRGHRVIKDFFEKADLPKNYFNLVIMNHTLEHMDNPGAVLKKIHTILKKKGALFVDVPNAGGLWSKLLGKYWPYRLPEEHKWQFTRGSLSEVFKKAGFRILHWESRSGIFEYANPITELRRKRFILDILLFPYSLLATLLGMGDSMSLAGVKK